MGNARKGLIFYAMTLALALVVAASVPWVGEASLPITMLTPAVATIIMLSVIAPEGGVRHALSLLGVDRLGLKGWLVAIFAPSLLQFAGLAILVAAGLTLVGAPQLSQSVAGTVLDIAAGLVVGTLFALCEEVGWRGYFLPKMLGYGVLPAMLMVGLLHGIWHLPLMLSTDYYHNTGNAFIVVPLFLITLTLAGVFYGYLRLWTGSVWPVALAHGSVNTAWDIVSDLSQTKSPLVMEYLGGESGLLMIAGLMVFAVLIYRYGGLSRLARGTSG